MTTDISFKELFMEMHPDFFDKEHIRNMAEDVIFHEMILDLESFDSNIYQRKLSDDVSFGFYNGTLNTIQEIVNSVDSDWGRYYNGAEPIYCGYHRGRPVSFCLITDYGTYDVGNRKIRIGGPGCVGTIPQYRDKGIGLTMVKNVTSILKRQGYDLAYIHFTREAPWYAKLGFHTSLRWNCNGIIVD